MTIPTRERHIRGYEPGELESVIDLALAAWSPVFESVETVLGADLFARVHPDWTARQRDAVADAIETNETWLSEEGDEIVGFVNVVFEDEEQSGEIHMLAVDPDFQHQGIGTELTEFALAEMRRRGITLAIAWTGGDPGHEPARRTFEGAGFTPLPQVWYSRLLESRSDDP